MRVSKAQKIRLGVFVFSGFMLIAVLIAIVAGNKLMEKRDIFYIEYSDSSVNGLSTGGAVKYHGIDIGRVDKIEISPDDITMVVVTISVERGTPIKEDVEATLVPVGITGLKSIEITGGTNASQLLPPKSKIPSGVSAFDNITGKAESIAEKLEILVANLNEITNPKTQRQISEIVSTTNDIVSENKDALFNTMSNLEQITDNANSLVENLSVFSNDLEGIDVKQLIQNLNITIERTNTAVNNIDKMVLKNRTNIDETMDTLRETIENLNEFAKQINENPSILIRGSSNQE
ncbi:MAG: MCE family protein [Candidatus Cloacimonetes bacterium]|nr:MCE family protein [Candidatus Cloacimonadota bacterium]